MGNGPLQDGPFQGAPAAFIQQVILAHPGLGFGVHDDQVRLVALPYIAPVPDLEAVGDGVKVIACEKTMTNQKLSKEDMLPKIGYVKAGVVEIMQKQQQGYAYLRP